MGKGIPGTWDTGRDPDRHYFEFGKRFISNWACAFVMSLNFLDPRNRLSYQTNIHFKVNKSIKMQMTFHTIIDDNASSKIQFRQLFGLGVNYNFHDKVTY